MSFFLLTCDFQQNRLTSRDQNFVFDRKIGTTGSGDDQFASINNATCDGTYVYTCEEGPNNRLVKRKFSDFAFVSKIGSTGSGNDQFDVPMGICTDGIFLYIVEFSNNRLTKRNCSDLAFVSKVDNGFGSGNDQFNNPVSICTDGTYLYISDRYNHRIVKRLCSNLTYVSKIGTFGSGNDNFTVPGSITTDGTYLYICDRGNYRVVKRLNSDLSYVSEYGSYGSGNNELKSTSGIACDDTYLYVGDSENGRVVKRLKSDLSYISQYGSYGSGDDQFLELAGITIADATPPSPPLPPSSKRLLVADASNARIHIRDADSLALVNMITSAGGGYSNNFSFNPSSCSDGTYLYTIDYNQDRLVKQLLDGTYIAEYRYAGIYSFNEWSGRDSFWNPYSIATDGTYLYIADSENLRIMKIRCSNLSFVQMTGTVGANNGAYAYAFLARGNYIYYTDANLSFDLQKVNISDYNRIDVMPSVLTQSAASQGLACDGTYIYIIEGKIFSPIVRNDRVRKIRMSDWQVIASRDIKTNDYFTYDNIASCYTDGVYLYTIEYSDGIFSFAGSLVVDAVDNKKVSSVEYTFTSADIGRCLEITFGTGWTRNQYEIVGVSGGAAILLVSPAPVGTSGGEGQLTNTMQSSQSIVRRDLNTLEIVRLGGDLGYYNPTLIGVVHSANADLVTGSFIVGESVTLSPTGATGTCTGYTDIGGGIATISFSSTNNVQPKQYDIITGLTSGNTGRFYDPGFSINEVRYLARCQGIAVDDTHIYIADYWNNQLTRLNKSDLTFDAVLLVISAYDVAIDDLYYYVISDIAPWAVTKYDKATSTLQAINNTSMGSWGTGRLSIDPNDANYIWAVGSNESKHVKLNRSDLTMVSKMPDPSDNGYNGPIDDNSFLYGYHLSMSSDLTELWIADLGNYDINNIRVKVHRASDLSFIRQYVLGSDYDTLNSVAADDTYFYVAVNNWSLGSFLEKRRISDGSFVCRNTPHADGISASSFIEGIRAYGSYLYVIDGSDNRLYRYNKDLTLFDYLGTPSRAPGSGNNEFYYPVDLNFILSQQPTTTKTFGQVIW